MMSSLAAMGLLLFAVLPHTNNYTMQSYGFGSGGVNNAHTTTYSLEGTTGDASAQTTTGSITAQSKPGYIQTQQASVPKFVSIDNGTNHDYYNKLHFIIDNTQGSATDTRPANALYLIQVSTDNFANVANYRYVQPDGTLSSSLAASDYQTYAVFGGAGGSQVIGLQPSLTYYFRMKVTQGKDTESAYGPVTSQATAAASITFNLTPNTINLGTLSASSVTSQNVVSNVTTNAASGADVYVSGKNGGLLSASQNHLISAVSNNLDVLSNGFGLVGATAQTSGGPLSAVSPYNGSGNVVGLVNATTRSIFTASSAVNGGQGTVAVKAKVSATDVAASDYQEVLTFTASANF